MLDQTQILLVPQSSSSIKRHLTIRGTWWLQDIHLGTLGKYWISCHSGLNVFHVFRLPCICLLGTFCLTSGLNLPEVLMEFCGGTGLCLHYSQHWILNISSLPSWWTLKYSACRIWYLCIPRIWHNIFSTWRMFLYPLQTRVSVRGLCIAKLSPIACSWSESKYGRLCT